MERDTVLYMKDIVKSYQMGTSKVEVLKKVSLEVKKGEFVAVLGPSGSGKSTLMNIIGCIDTADSGEYVLNGTDMGNRTEDELADIRNKEIGFVFQKYNLFSKYTAIENVQFPLLLRRMERNKTYEKSKMILEQVGLGDKLSYKPLELSGGQQQRVSIARALVGEPKILLADEPTGALDSKSGAEIMDMFLKLNEEGNTIVLITHDLEIAKYANRIVHVKDGNIYDV